VGSELISEYAEMILISEYMYMLESEQKAFKGLGALLEDFPVWTDYLKGVCGIGPAMAGVIVSEIDIEKAKYPSSIWRYAGLDVAEDGHGRSRKAEHLIDQEYVSKEGEIKTRKSITFNPFLKTKLTGVLGASFIKQGERSEYCGIYRAYRNRIENRPDLAEESKGHKHNMAVRYMIKMFLIDLYNNWKKIEGLPIEPPYHEAKLGIYHGKSA